MCTAIHGLASLAILAALFVSMAALVSLLLKRGAMTPGRAQIAAWADRIFLALMVPVAIAVVILVPAQFFC